MHTLVTIWKKNLNLVYLNTICDLKIAGNTSPSIGLLFIGGIAAGAIAIATSLLLRLFAGGPFIPEIASQTLFSLTPGATESQAVGTFGSLAKYSAFIGAIVANLILYGIIAMLRSALTAASLGKIPSLKNRYHDIHGSFGLQN